MNASNRTLGRVLLVIVGLVLLVGGLAAVAVETLDMGASLWHAVASSLAPFGSAADRGDSVAAWSIAFGVAALVGILAIVVIATRGGGRVDVVIEDEEASAPVAGTVRIDATALQHALSSAVGAMPQVASLAVDVYRVRGERAVRITVRPKRGSAPSEIAEQVEGVVVDLDALLGVRLPVLLRIARGGAGSGQRDRVH